MFKFDDEDEADVHNLEGMADINLDGMGDMIILDDSAPDEPSYPTTSNPIIIDAEKPAALESANSGPESKSH